MSHAPLEVVNRVRRETKFNINEGVGKVCQSQRESQCYHLARTANKRLGNRQSGAIYARFPGSAVDTPPPNDESVILMCK